MIMSKYNSSLVHLVQVVTPPQYYDWCAAVWLQGPESVPPVSVSRHCRQSAGSPVPPTAGSCSCLQPGCSGLQGTAATCSTVHTLDSSSASRGTDTQQLLSIITPYHGPCFQDLTFFYIFKITFMFISSVGLLFLALQYQGSSTSNSSNSSFLKTLGLPPGPLGKSLQYMCRTLSPSRSPGTIGVSHVM